VYSLANDMPIVTNLKIIYLIITDGKTNARMLSTPTSGTTAKYQLSQASDPPANELRRVIVDE